MGFIDLKSATTAAYAILMALIHRQKSGEGQYIDLASQETVAILNSDMLLDYIMNGRVKARRGNRHADRGTRGGTGGGATGGRDAGVAVGMATTSGGAGVGRSGMTVRICCGIMAVRSPAVRPDSWYMGTSNTIKAVPSSPSRT